MLVWTPVYLLQNCVGVGVTCGVLVGVSEDVTDGVGVREDVMDGLTVIDGVTVVDGVTLEVNDGVTDGVILGVTVLVGVTLGVTVLVGVTEGEGGGPSVLNTFPTQ